MSVAADALRIGALLLVAAVIQVSVVAGTGVFGGVPDLLLVTLVAVALLRGAVAGAAAGFFAGLVVDTATLDTLGLTSLLLTVVGYWIGRYGETSARERAHAPILSVAVATVLFLVGGVVLHFVLGDEIAAGHVLRGLVPAVVLNALLTVPVHALVRRALGGPAAAARAVEVRLLG